MSNFNSTLTQERLKNRLSYDESSGLFTWIKASIGVKISDEVGTITRNGYRVVMFDKCNYHAHRLAWLYVYGSWPEQFIDHINGVKTDNRICNLRQVNKSENGQNLKGARKDNKSGFLGVTKHGQTGWRSTIQIDGATIHLGTFRSPELAHNAYIKAKRQLHPTGTL